MKDAMSTDWKRFSSLQHTAATLSAFNSSIAKGALLLPFEIAVSFGAFPRMGIR